MTDAAENDYELGTHHLLYISIASVTNITITITSTRLTKDHSIILTTATTTSLITTIIAMAVNSRRSHCLSLDDTHCGGC